MNRLRFIQFCFTFGLIGLIGLSSSTTFARTFDFKTEKFAAFFGGSYGMSAAGSTAYGGVVDDVTYDKQTTWNASGRFGFLFSGAKVSFRVEVEVVKPRTFADLQGTNAAGTKLFTLSSSLLGVLPMATLEYNIKSTNSSRWFASLGGGLATVTADNTYEFTTDGTAAYHVADYKESANATSTAWELATGYEFLFTDTVTLLFDLGYRYVPISNFKSSKDVTSLTGAQTVGSDWVNANGTKRTINLSGPYTGLTFRFYL